MKNKQRKGFSIWEILGVLALILTGAALVIPALTRPRHPERKPSCLNNLKQIGLALTQYQQDWNEKMPLISLAPSSNVNLERDYPSSYNKQHAYGWADASFAYLKNVQCFQCPFDRNGRIVNPTKNGFTDYWLNSNVSGLEFLYCGDAKQIIMLGDGNDGKDLTNARYNLPKLPTAWINDPKSPVYRHKGMANYAFLDGHVKALTPDKITCEPTGNGKPTFAVK